jgi:hypothetical protein
MAVTFSRFLRDTRIGLTENILIGGTAQGTRASHVSRRSAAQRRRGGTRALCESDRARRNRSLSLFLFQRFVAPDAALQHRNVRRRGTFMVFLIDGFG